MAIQVGNRSGMRRGAGLLVVAIALVAVVGAQINSLSPTTPAQTAGASTKPEAATDLVRLMFAGAGIQLDVPDGWRAVADDRPTIARVTNETGASMTVFHGGPYSALVCDQRCELIRLPELLPYDPGKTLDALADRLSSRLGAMGWFPATGLHPRLNDARRLDVRQAGAPPRTYVIASYLNGIVLVAASLPDGADSRTVLGRLLAGVQPYPANLYNAGALVGFSDIDVGIALAVPDTWPAHRAGPRTWTFGERRLTVSVANAHGVLNVCEPACHTVKARDLDGLADKVFTPERGGANVGRTTLAGAPARSQLDRSTRSASYRVLGEVGGRLIHLWFDRTDPGVDVAVIQSIQASLAFLEPPRFATVDRVLVGDGFRISLPRRWGRTPELTPTIMVSAGDDHDRLWICSWSGYSSSDVPCSIETASDLHALVDAVRIGGAPRPWHLDGERAVVFYVERYEYPAHGTQWLAYIVATHHGRPFVIRLWNGTSSERFVDEIRHGFRFTD